MRDLSKNELVFICAVLNTLALATVGVLSLFTNLSEGMNLAIGSLFIIASMWPYSKARKLYARENNLDDLKSKREQAK